MDTITKSLAKELGPRKIRVNAINPGMMATEGQRAGGLLGSDFQKTFESRSALGRIGQPDDIAPAVVFLASPGCRLDHGRNTARLRRLWLTPVTVRRTTHVGYLCAWKVGKDVGEGLINSP